MRTWFEQYLRKQCATLGCKVSSNTLYTSRQRRVWVEKYTRTNLPLVERTFLCFLFGGLGGGGEVGRNESSPNPRKKLQAKIRL